LNSDKITAILSYFVMVLLYLAPFFLLHAFSARYRIVIAEEIAYQFVQESYESGITESSYTKLIEMSAKLEGTVKVTLEGKDRTFTDTEILTEILSGPLEVYHNEFLTCIIYIDNLSIRIGGRP